MSRLLIDPDSKPVTLPKLNFFSTPGTVTEIEKVSITKLKPIATLEGARELEFKYPGSENEAVDISKTTLHLWVKLVRKDGTAITTEITIAPCNGLGHTIFKNFRMYMGDTLVESSSDMYGHQNYMTVISNYTLEGIAAQFLSALYRMDDAGEFENFLSTTDIKVPAVTGSDAVGTSGTQGYKPAVPASAAVLYKHSELNNGFDIRRDALKLNREVELIVPIQMPTTNHGRCFPPRLPFRMVFTKADAETYLCTGPGVNGSLYDIKITRAELWVTKLQLEHTKAQAVEMMWKTIPVKIPILREQMLYHTVDSGHKNVLIPNLRIGRCPDAVEIFAMKSVNFAGSYTTNPQLYEHFNLESIDLRWNSESLPGMPIVMDYKKGNYMQPWTLLSKRYFRKNRGIFVSHWAFTRGYCFYHIDLTNDAYSSSGMYYPIVRSGGILEVHFKFADPLTQAITFGFKFFSNNQMNINSDLTVTHDFDP